MCKGLKIGIKCFVAVMTSRWIGRGVKVTAVIQIDGTADGKAIKRAVDATGEKRRRAGGPQRHEVRDWAGTQKEIVRLVVSAELLPWLRRGGELEPGSLTLLREARANASVRLGPRSRSKYRWWVCPYFHLCCIVGNFLRDWLAHSEVQNSELLI
jgi:hypothetical protein